MLPQLLSSSLFTFDTNASLVAALRLVLVKLGCGGDEKLLLRSWQEISEVIWTYASWVRLPKGSSWQLRRQTTYFDELVNAAAASLTLPLLIWVICATKAAMEAICELPEKLPILQQPSAIMLTPAALVLEALDELELVVEAKDWAWAQRQEQVTNWICILLRVSDKTRVSPLEYVMLQVMSLMLGLRWTCTKKPRFYILACSNASMPSRQLSARTSGLQLVHFEHTLQLCSTGRTQASKIMRVSL